jgi:hypothetical protein
MKDFHKGFDNMCTKGKGVHVFCVYTCDICGLKSECESHLYTFDGLTPLWETIYVLKFHYMSGIILVVYMVITTKCILIHSGFH